MTAQKTIDAAVERFAAQSHNAWRRQFLKANPKEKSKPRLRLRGGKMVDINKPWATLDPAAKADNRIAALAAHDALASFPGDREAAAAAVHRAWIKRNRSDASLSKDLFKPYKQLSEAEKDKDRAHIDRMQAALAAVSPAKARRAKPAKGSSAKSTHMVAVDAALYRRLEAAARRLGRAAGRAISAEDLLAASANAVLTVIDPAPRAKRKR